MSHYAHLYCLRRFRDDGTHQLLVFAGQRQRKAYLMKLEDDAPRHEEVTLQGWSESKAHAQHVALFGLTQQNLKPEDIVFVLTEAYQWKRLDR